MDSRQNVQIDNLRSHLPILFWRYWAQNDLVVSNKAERQEYAMYNMDSSIKFLFLLSNCL